MGLKNAMKRIGASQGHRVIAATKADSGVDAAVTAYGGPSFIMLSADGTIKLTTIAGDTVSLALLGKVQYRLSPQLVWSTGSDPVTVYLIW